MRVVYALAVLAAPLLAGAAQAQTVTGTVTVDGSVANRCTFGINSANIPLGEISLPTTGKLDTSKVDGQNRTLTGFCNGTAARMAVEAQPLLNALAAPAGFDNRVNYTATANANSVNATDTSVTAGAGSSVLVGQFTGNILVTLSASSSPTAGIMVAGNYNGQVLVTLNPVP